MVQANKVTCWNRAGFVQKFQANGSVDGKEYATDGPIIMPIRNPGLSIGEYSIPDGANVSWSKWQHIWVPRKHPMHSHTNGDVAKRLTIR